MEYLIWNEEAQFEFADAQRPFVAISIFALSLSHHIGLALTVIHSLHVEVADVAERRWELVASQERMGSTALAPMAIGYKSFRLEIDS